MKGGVIMLTWLAVNLGNIAVTVILVAVVTAIIIKLIKDKKAGKASCGCNCSHCSANCGCHNKNNNVKII